MIVVDEIFNGVFIIYEITIGSILEGIYNLFWLLIIVGIFATPVYLYGRVSQGIEDRRAAEMQEYILPASAPLQTHVVKTFPAAKTQGVDFSRYVKTSTSVWPYIDYYNNTITFSFVGNDRYHNMRSVSVNDLRVKVGRSDEPTVNYWQVSPNGKWIAFICPGYRYYDFQLPDILYISPVSDSPVSAKAAAYIHSNWVRWSKNSHRIYFSNWGGPWKYQPEKTSIVVHRETPQTYSTVRLEYINWP